MAIPSLEEQAPKVLFLCLPRGEMLGCSGLIDLLEESSHRLNMQTLVATELGNTSLSKRALAVEPCLACLLPFLGFWASVAKPLPIRTRAPCLGGHSTDMATSQRNASSWALYSLACLINHFSICLEYCPLIVGLSFTFVITKGCCIVGWFLHP